MITAMAKAALGAALVAGLLVSLLQALWTTPLILHAELFEVSASLFDVDQTFGVWLAHGDMNHQEWAPQEGAERILFTVISNIGLCFGYSLILLALMTLAKVPLTRKTGLAWGTAGFFAVGLAPAFGLSPELPGMMAADIVARQWWWIACVISTSVGLFIMLLRGGITMIVLGVILLAAPHVVGAPHLSGFSQGIPPELAAQFSARAIGLSAITWILCGTIAGSLMAKFESLSKDRPKDKGEKTQSGKLLCLYHLLEEIVDRL